jgi:hypothetical protein
MRTMRLLIPGCLMAATLAMPMQGLAQDGTPEPDMTLPLCTAEPRDIDEMVALWFEASGTPAATPAMTAAVPDPEALPAGERADDATVEAISTVTKEWLACMEVAGQYARGFSLLSDQLLAQFGPDVTNPEQDTPEEVKALMEAQLAGTPIAGSQGMQVPLIVGPRKPRLLDDGRVGAIWSLGGDRVFLVYKQQEDGSWLIDDAVDILEPVGTPEATPAA